MPNVKLPTGVDFYYETHGQGEPLIFVPSTAYSGEVWKPWQMPLASSLNLSSTIRAAAAGRCRRNRVYTIEQMALDIVALMEHLKTAVGAFHRPLDGRAHRTIAGAELSRAGKELDHGGERLGPARRGRARIAFRVCRIAWSSIWSRWVSRNSSTTRSSSRTPFSPRITASSTATRWKSSLKSPGRPTPSCRSVHPSLHRAPQFRRHAPAGRCQGADFGSDRRGRHGRQQSYRAVQSVGASAFPAPR